MASSHPSADLDDEQHLRSFIDNMRQKYTQSTDTKDVQASGLCSRDSQYLGGSINSEDSPGKNQSEDDKSDPMSAGYEDKSTQTDPVTVGSSSQPTAPNSESLPDIPSYEISQIISDAIDNLPPGSLQPLEESMFAPGSKRNIEYKAACKAGKNSSSRMSVAGKAKVPGWNDPECLTEAKKSDQTGVTFSNRFSPLASPGSLDGISQATQKSLIGPGLYSKSARSKREESDLDDVEPRIHTYSPGPGILLRFESVGKSSPTKDGPRVPNKSWTPSFGPSSTAAAQVAITSPSSKSSESLHSLQITEVPPHLRAAQRSDTVEPSETCITEPTYDNKEFGNAIKGEVSKKLRMDISALGEIKPLGKSAISSVEIDEKGLSTSQSPRLLHTSVIKSAKVKEEDLSSPSLYKENQPPKPSLDSERLPPHLRKTESRIPVESLHRSVIKSNASDSSPFLSSDTLAPRAIIATPVRQQVLPISETNNKPDESTLWPSSDTSQAVSAPTKAPGALSSEDEATNLEGALFFKAWPKSEPRDTPAAEIRRVVITNLPSNATSSLVASLVFGGPLEQIHVKGRTAQVLFLHAKDCQKYYDATANGVDYTFEDQKGLAQVAKAADVDVVSGQAHTFIKLGFTRCVRATGIGNDYTIAKLKEKAAHKGRNVQDVTLGTNESGLTFAIFRFCDIRHALQFKLTLEREEEWEDCNIHFSPDPCA